MKKERANELTQARRKAQTTRKRSRERRARGTQQRRSVGVTRDVGQHEEQKNSKQKKRRRERGANINGHSTAHDELTPHCEREQHAKNRRNRRAAPHQPHGHKNEGSTCHTHTPVENSTMDVDVHPDSLSSLSFSQTSLCPGKSHSQDYFAKQRRNLA